MCLLHKGLPDFSWVGIAHQAVHLFWHIISNPHAGRVISRIADQPAVFVVVGGSRLSGARHIRQSKSAPRTVGKNSL